MRIDSAEEQGVLMGMPLRDAAYRQAERVGRYREVRGRAHKGPRNRDLPRASKKEVGKLVSLLVI